MLTVALLAGACAAWLSQRHVQARLDMIDAEERAGRMLVVVAAADLAPGMALDAAAVAVREAPAQWMPSGALTPERYAEVEGGVLAHGVRRGEPILLAYMESARAAGLSERLEAGRRAITISVDEISSVSGLVRPGDRVDLYVSLDHRGKRVTRLLLQAMKVLAAGRQVEQSDDVRQGGFSTLTLDASPQDAIKLIAAREGGTLTAMLRRPGDGSPAAGRAEGDLAAMLGLRDEPRPAPPPKPAVSVIYGDRPQASIPSLGFPLDGAPWQQR